VIFMDEQAPIEEYFPVEKINEIAEREGSGGATKRYYRPIYSIHKSFARRLGSVFRSIALLSLIDKDTKYFDENFNEWKKIEMKNPTQIWEDYFLHDIDFNGKKVIDPFLGKGVPIVEALRMKANVIGKELNPVPWLITKKEIEEVDIKKLEKNFKKMIKEVKKDIREFYKTKCPICRTESDVIYFFWHENLECSNCGNIEPHIKKYRIANARSTDVENNNIVICECGSKYDPKNNNKCPECEKNYNKDDYTYIFCKECGSIFGVTDINSERKCPFCKESINPKNGPVTRSGRYFICEECGQKNKIIESIKKNGKRDVRYDCSVREDHGRAGLGPFFFTPLSRFRHGRGGGKILRYVWRRPHFSPSAEAGGKCILCRYRRPSAPGM